MAILARGREPIETGRGAAGQRAKTRQSRYLEAVVGGVVVGCLYLPNGNPQPGPKFDYKLEWFERFNAHARKLLRLRPAGGAGRRLQRGADRRRHLQPGLLARRRAAAAGEPRRVRAPAGAGLDRCHPRAATRTSALYTFWDYWRNRWPRDAGLRIDHLLLNAELAPLLVDAGVDREVRGRPGASDHAPAWIQLNLPYRP